MVTLTINWSNTLTVVGFGFTLVLIILTLLVFLLLIFEKAVNFKVPRQKIEKTGKVITPEQESDQSSEVIAAIAMALDSYTNDIHEHESMVLTIKKTSTDYSPWNARKYN